MKKAVVRIQRATGKNGGAAVLVGLFFCAAQHQHLEAGIAVSQHDQGGRHSHGADRHERRGI
jgi:hypothetical protein